MSDTAATGRIVPRYAEGVARARCHRCDAEVAVTGHDATAALLNLHRELERQGWSRDAFGRRLCPRHPAAPETAA